jgi:Tol biopolymer transport system component/predicted Ser/Thr protein kinase
MPLAPGERLAHFEIRESIGKGGMGEVYKAHDTRLGRDVAVKVSAERFSDRFEREARAIAALNHANICALYDVGPNYLVMEFVDGESPKGPLPVATVVEYARQMAAALDTAHEKGITHRDLKPANLKVTPDGQLKVLDFGLAKMDAAGAPPVTADSPTLASAVMTQAGIILGTAAYMAPEQAKGKPVDKRADIWAYGVVLYELATGKPLFKGDDISEVLASVLRDQPDMAAVPPQLAPLIRRCLEKNPRLRLRDIADAPTLLDLPAIAASLPQPSSEGRGWLPWTVAAVLGAAAATFATLWLQPDPLPVVTRFQIHAPPGMTLALGTPAVSPDGRTVAFVAADAKRNTQIYLQRLDRDDAVPLPGTEGAQHPFWSPDGRSLAFVADTTMKRIDVDGGAPRVLSDGITGPWHGDWNAADDILVQMAGGTHRLSARSSGGTAAVLKTTDLTTVGHPAFLPDGRRFLFRQVTGRGSVIRLTTLDGATNDGPIVVAADSAPLVAQTPGGDWMLYLRDPDLLAVEFDVPSGSVRGDPVVLVPNIGIVAIPPVKPSVGVSRNGVLAFQGGGADAGSIQWFSRTGVRQGSMATQGRAQRLSVSPDGSTLATRQNGDFWVTDIARGITTRLTSNARNQGGAWSPDGKEIGFSRNVSSLVAVKADGSGERVLDPSPRAGAVLDAWSTRGPVLTSGGELHLAESPMRGPATLLPTLPLASAPEVSPDGRFIAYVARPATGNEVFVQAMPPGTGRIQVSASGGNQPRWRGDSNELIFLDLARSTVMAAEILPGTIPRAGVPRELFAVSGLNAAWDVSPDGQRFFFWQPSGAQANNPITVVQNWWVGLKK